MTHGFPSLPSRPSRRHGRRNESGVALIIVLGFLGLMVMMAVAFMIQARVERIVADSTLEGMRARQVVQTGLAAGIQDYVNAMQRLGQTNAAVDLFLSGHYDKVTSYSGQAYDYSGEYYDSTNLWNGEAADWLPETLPDTVDLDAVEDMEWIWVRKDPGHRSRILGRYAYACLNLSGGVDANLLGRAFGQDAQKLADNSYGGSPTNRDNVRKMVLNGIRATPSPNTEQQHKLARYQSMWKGFDTPAALNLLTDGKSNTGSEEDKDRWSAYIGDERDGDKGPLATDHLSCYSYAALHRTNTEYVLRKCTTEGITEQGASPKKWFDLMVEYMGGDETTKDDIKKALRDYTNSLPYPAGTDYPSVKDVPMFNEILTEIRLVEARDVPGAWQVQVDITPEFWCPFPSKDNQDGSTYLLSPLSMAGGTDEGTEEDGIWIRGLFGIEGQSGPAAGVKLKQAQVTPAKLPVQKTLEPQSPGKFTYLLDIEGLVEDDYGNLPVINRMYVHSVTFKKPWTLTLEAEGGKAVDATPAGGYNTLSFKVNPQNIRPGDETGGRMSVEVDDPRLNHLKDRWNPHPNASGSIGKKNECLRDAQRTALNKMHQWYARSVELGDYMYCRNGPMQSPAELGYIPIFAGNTPWLTLDIFSDYGINLMNSLVCDTGAWNCLATNNVFYTNGTINPYTRDSTVLSGAFYGLDAREVPNMEGSDHLGASKAKNLAQRILEEKTVNGKHGPGGWTRILHGDLGFDCNVNERVALACNTWGLFNESDTLFLIFVVAQSITEAPEKVDPEGTWNANEDMITGERWAVALCWIDSGGRKIQSGSDPTRKGDATQEMDIIMFRYLND